MTAGDEVDDAVMAALQGDATLGGLAPGGIYRDKAPEGATDLGVIVIVQLQAHEDVDEQADDPAYEVPRYLVKAVGLDTNGAAVVAAYKRAHVVMRQPLTIVGYKHMDTRRESRVAYTEPDGPLYWKHAGGLYRVEADPS